MSKSLFINRAPLDKFHTYLLDTLIEKHVQEFKKHRIDLENNLIVFYNDTIFGGIPWGKKKYKSIGEVLTLGIIPNVAHEVAEKTQGDLLKIKLELEINIEKYLTAGMLDKAIEILTSYTLEKLKEDVLINLTEDTNGLPSVAMVGNKSRVQNLAPGGEEIVNIHINTAPNLREDNYEKAYRVIRESQSFPVKIVNNQRE